jgi:hypothetical protein
MIQPIREHQDGTNAAQPDAHRGFAESELKRQGEVVEKERTVERGTVENGSRKQSAKAHRKGGSAQHRRPNVERFSGRMAGFPRPVLQSQKD